MRIVELRKILQEFAREARQGRITTATGTGQAVADLAEQLDRALDNMQKQYTIKSDTISFSPAKCPCCGK